MAIVLVIRAQVAHLAAILPATPRVTLVPARARGGGAGLIPRAMRRHSGRSVPRPRLRGPNARAGAGANAPAHVGPHTKHSGKAVPPSQRLPGTAKPRAAVPLRTYGSASPRAPQPHGPVKTGLKGDASSSPAHAGTLPPSTPGRGIARDAKSRIKRSEAAKDAFMRQTGHPHGWPGHIVDHKKPLACGGADNPSNMQWQTTAEAKAKDKVERVGCR